MNTSKKCSMDMHATANSAPVTPPKGPMGPPRKKCKGTKRICPLKPGLKCSVLSAKRVDKGIVNTIRDGRCYAEMCPGVKRLVHNNPWDGFGSKAGYSPDEFSLIAVKAKTAVTEGRDLEERIECLFGEEMRIVKSRGQAHGIFAWSRGRDAEQYDRSTEVLT